MTQIGDSSARIRVTGAGAEAPTFLVSWSALSDLGKKRKVNEDSVVATPPIFAVADGMGGHAAGDIASAAVVNRLGAVSGEPFTTGDVIDEALLRALEDIDVVGDANERGTGTTVTGVALTQLDGHPTWAIFNIGDSRVYLYESASLERLTIDHSVVQELVDAGLITAEQAETHPDSNIITRAVGFHETPAPDYSTLAVAAGQRFLVCSDGLTKELTDHGIAHYLAISVTAEDAARSLVEAALSNGGRDNVTVLVIDVELAE
ncbi:MULTISPECIES: PP2C family protein-serine/threonine phosphatase [Subtercola]|uniref:Serine/threonine-protein phosphatase n=1 Tax=Subtercola vilae TaxID=2056433 RepID=A0A4T2BFW3_9MICO|nr:MULTISPECIES: protein phosphatase 2C domain-containing protein [Subtercola]MEA9985174.1 protein phosphatase 2C domain-containing protein [Subtercola sp. RTI3]TIH30107.1 serine/threonine-protein phosphatase [Subtercola vilae]